MANADTLAQYLEGLDDTRAKTVQAVVDVVLAGHPDATVKISWNVPQVQLGGKYVFGIAAAKNHISLSPWSNVAMQLFADRLAQYNPTDNLFRVPVDWQVDHALITDLVDVRLAELAHK